MDLKKKLAKYGREVLSQQESNSQKRKKRRMVQRLRRIMRNKQAALHSRINEINAQEEEKDKVMEEYLAAEDAEVTSEEIG